MEGKEYEEGQKNAEDGKEAGSHRETWKVDDGHGRHMASVEESDMCWI